MHAMASSSRKRAQSPLVVPNTLFEHLFPVSFFSQFSHFHSLSLTITQRGSFGGLLLGFQAKVPHHAPEVLCSNDNKDDGTVFCFIDIQLYTCIYTIPWTDKMSPDKMSRTKCPRTKCPGQNVPDKMFLDKMSPDKKSPDKKSPDKMSPDKMSPDKMSPEKMSLTESRRVKVMSLHYVA